MLNHFDLEHLILYNARTFNNHATTNMNVKDIRRENLRCLAKNVGGITALAQQLGKSQSQVSHVIGINPIKNIGDRLAVEIEQKFDKPYGWLDKEHFKTPQERGYLPKDDTQRMVFWVPVLEWEQIDKQQPTIEILQQATKYIPVNFEVGQDVFALTVVDNSMEASSGISFPSGTIVVIDPAHIPTDKSFVVAQVQENEAPQFRQLTTKGKKRRFLKPLNRRFPTVEISYDCGIFGVIRQMQINFG